MHLKALPEDALHTARFTERSDRLFNAFNSVLQRMTQEMGHAFRDKSDHQEFLIETLTA